MSEIYTQGSQFDTYSYQTTVEDRDIYLDRLYDELPDNSLEDDLDMFKHGYEFNGVEYD